MGMSVHHPFSAYDAIICGPLKKSIPDISGSVIGFLPYFDFTLVIAGIFENHTKRQIFVNYPAMNCQA